MTDRVWSSLPNTPRKAFGSALGPVTEGRICHPQMITEETRTIRCKRLRKAIDGEKA